jgi:hypothetical protein
MLVIVSGVWLDGGVPDQELLPGYRSWSWRCCSRSPHRPVEAPHRPVECHPRSENGPSGPSTTCLVGLTRPTLAAPLTTGRSRPPRWRTRRPLRLRVSRPGRARQALLPGSTVGARCGSGLAMPAGLVGGRSPATRPRAVTPREPPEDAPARGDQHPARLGVRQGPQMHLLAEARRRPAVHPADLRLALSGLPHSRQAVLQSRRPAVPGAR